MLSTQQPELVVTFEVHPEFDAAASKKEGRKIFKDMEICKIRFPGDRNKISVFPAHAFARWEDTEEGSEAMTYAQLYSEQYRRFKASEHQTMSGTPISELGFTPAKISEMKALNIYTVDQLAALDGQPLKNLGMGGRDLKNQATEYLKKSHSVFTATDFAAKDAEIAELRRQLAASKNTDDAYPTHESPFDGFEDDDIKIWIKDRTGSAPRGNPSHAKLVRLADELNAKEIEKQDEAA